MGDYSREKQPMKSLFLVDGSALVHRAFHAFQGRARLTTRGKDVGMLYGFLNSLLSVIRREKPDRLGVAFDTSAPTFRHKLYEAYKANRPPMDEALREQIPILYELLQALNVPQLMIEGYEADDIIGTLAVRGAQEGYQCFIVAGDKDFYQLVDQKISLYRLPVGRSNELPEVIDPEGVVRKFGVPPHQVIDTLALMGDSSDNVPGVPGVGEKTSVELIKRFGSLEEVIAHADQIEKATIRENIKQHAELARKSRDLVIIDTSVPLEITPHDLTYGPLNNHLARKKLLELEFASLLRQIEELEPEIRAHPGGPPGEGEGAEEKLPGEEFSVSQAELLRTSRRDYRLIDTPEALFQLVKHLQEQGAFSLDTETTSIDPMQAELVGISFSTEPGAAYYLTVNHFQGPPSGYSSSLYTPLRPTISPSLCFILETLKPLLEDERYKKYGQNLKYDLLALKCYGIEVKGVEFDTMIASYLLDPTARQHGIDYMAETYLGLRKIPTAQLIGKGAHQLSMAEVPVDQVCEYACEDADVALRLVLYFRQQLKKNQMERLFYELEIPLMMVLLQMEFNGVKLDVDYLSQLSRQFQEEMDDLEREIYELAGLKFNINSTQQLAEVLYQRLKLPKGRRTKLGYSTDNEELERLRQEADSPIPGKLLRYRHLAKLKSTYIDALPRMIHPLTGRVHTSYSQTSTATGRIASSDPNLQNIPIRTEEGGWIRRAFVPGEEGWLILSADYSQIELRIMAHLSQDERLIYAFEQGWDIHRATAAWMNEIPPEEVTPEMRRQAKEVNFGVLYGMGEFGLSQRLGIPRARAREFIEQYFTQFKQVKEYIEKLHQQARERGYVETIMGRRRPIPDINSKNFNIRSNAERIAINTPIQGSAADLMKIAMIRVHKMLREEGFRARMLLQVHDELVFEVPQEEVERLSQRLKETMSQAMELSVPLEVGIGYGANWLEAHE